ncbi:MAG: prevent-host-death family protein [Alphaproteobacteria bacterium]|nr:prevent-host-death family protein [Alphaproteobacteria bacterium]
MSIEHFCIYTINYGDYMIREITAMEARKNFRELLNEVKYRYDSILIKKAGRPMATLIDVDLFEKIRILKYQFDSLTDELGKTYAGISTEDAEKEIKE